MNDHKILFDSVVFDKDAKTMTIVNGTKGTYSYKDIQKCSILNEKAKYHGSDTPFTAIVPNGPLGGGALWEFQIYVGLKLTMKDGTILAIYTSKEPTTIHTDYHLKDQSEAKKIKEVIEESFRNTSNTDAVLHTTIIKPHISS